MDDQARNLRAGLRALSRHRDQTALSLLRGAVGACPPIQSAELSQSLYWLSIALLRLGRAELAVKSLASAQKLTPRGKARKLYGRLVNEYGMLATGCEEKDDFRAFYSVQIRRYLGARTGGAFESETERDAIACLIADAWIDLKKSRTLESISCSEKLDLFRSIEIAFPVGFIPKERVLNVNFRRGMLQRADDRCFCGSGLPYRECCGRTHSPFEAERGSF